MDTIPTTQTPEATKNESQVWQISIRAWLAICLVGSIVISQIGIVALAIIHNQPDLLKIGEPLNTMAAMALAYYFGNKQQSNTNKPN